MPSSAASGGAERVMSAEATSTARASDRGITRSMGPLVVGGRRWIGRWRENPGRLPRVEAARYGGLLLEDVPDQGERDIHGQEQPVASPADEEPAGLRA